MVTCQPLHGGGASVKVTPSGHGRTCCWLDPVENDPKPTFDVLHFLSRLPGELPNCVPIMKGWNYIRPALPPAGRSSRRQVEISGG
jgi:hypothetical protein